MKLSVLDQSPVSSGMTPAQALRNTIDLAKLCDELGYQRYWIAEHHGLSMIATSTPEIMIALCAEATRSIRVGSGAVLLPHYAPLKVAETFRTLEALNPGRIDLGIGRAPGGDPLDAFALRRTRERAQFDVDDFPQQLVELLAFLRGGFAPDHPFSRIRVQPEGVGPPEVWLLGSSPWSASAAAQLSLPYAFAHFIGGPATEFALGRYKAMFTPSETLPAPKTILSIGALCAETDAEAERLAASSRAVIRRIRKGLQGVVPSVEEALAELAADPSPPPEEESPWPRTFVGSPATVRAGIEAMAAALGVDEMMILTITHDHAARRRSYELLAEAFGLQPG